MESLKFYDMKARKSFSTANYRIVNKSGKRFAVAKCPGGNEAWRILGKAG